MPTKIIKSKAITILLLLVFLSACSNGKEEQNDRLFKAMEIALTTSNNKLEDYNSMIMRSFQERLKDPEANGLAGVWYPKAVLVKKYSDERYTDLEELKRILGDSTSKNGISEILNRKRTSDLFDKLKECSKLLFSIDSGMTNEFPYDYISLPKEKIDFEKSFYSISKDAVSAKLSKSQNQIRCIENDFLNYLHKKTVNAGGCNFGRETQQIIASLSVEHVQPGGKIEITAGLGNFVRILNAKIVINGIDAEQDFEGLGVLKVKASTKYGKHKVPVTFEWKDKEIGQTRYITREVVYYVDSIPTKP